MRTIGIYSVIRRSCHGWTKRLPKEQAAENLLNCRFYADSYNKEWLTDVTEFKYNVDKKAYLSAILYLGDNHIITKDIKRD